MSKKSWIKKECEGCKSYNQECWLGVCSLYPDKKKTADKKEKYDTS